MSSQRKVHVGQVFGGLTVIEDLGIHVRPNGKTHRLWRCQCQCGKQADVSTSTLNIGTKRSCGCRLGKSWNQLDLRGQQFEFLTVIQKAESTENYGTKQGRWLCRCRCGNHVIAQTVNLRNGKTKSCGCRRYDPETKAMISSALTKHGHNLENSPTYRSWQAMRRRCEKKPGYADRGITFVPRWDSFVNFLADMGERPEGHTLDRIDNDGPYSPENCRWATGKTQSNNRRSNTHITYQGRTQTIAEWAREIGISRGALGNRVFMYGWPLEKAMRP